ncbi:MAG: hypothetical protein IPI57_14445 [Candidatus Competibacteraceae bacterium]|nr:hypothetical protein [Candidatus Competibacteraceae bacterium]
MRAREFVFREFAGGVFRHVDDQIIAGVAGDKVRQPAYQERERFSGARRADERDGFLFAVGPLVHRLDHIRRPVGVPRTGFGTGTFEHEVSGSGFRYPHPPGGRRISAAPARMS